MIRGMVMVRVRGLHLVGLEPKNELFLFLSAVVKLTLSRRTSSTTSRAAGPPS